MMTTQNIIILSIGNKRFFVSDLGRSHSERSMIYHKSHQKQWLVEKNKHTFGSIHEWKQVVNTGERCVCRDQYRCQRTCCSRIDRLLVTSNKTHSSHYEPVTEENGKILFKWNRRDKKLKSINWTIKRVIQEVRCRVENCCGQQGFFFHQKLCVSIWFGSHFQILFPDKL